MESLELLSMSLEEARANDWFQEQYAATNNIGSNYYRLGDFNEALKYYLDAYRLAEISLDKNSQMASINNIAVIYFQDRDFENAYAYFRKAYALAEELNAGEKQGIYALNIALVSNKMGALERAWEYVGTAEQLLSNSDDLIRVNLAKAEWHLLNKETKKAKALLIDLEPLIEKQDLKEDQMLQQMLLSEVYTQEGNYPLAISYGLRSIEVTTGRENLINGYLALSKLYAKTNNYPMALAYTDSVIINKDSLFKLKMDNGFEINKIKFQLMDSQQQLRESELQAGKNKVLLYSILSISFLLLTIGAIVHKNYKEKQRQQKKLSELEILKRKSENLLLEKQLKEKEVVAQLEKERYKHEMDAKNREILGKAFVQSSQGDAIQKLIDTIETDAPSAELEEFQTNLEQLKKFLKHSNHWQTFFLHYEKTNPGFIPRLREKHPYLTANEIRFITYIHINLSNKEIASLLNISYGAVRKRKERLANKLRLDSSSDLYPYLLDN